ncbi:hypothetical protein R3P38DRAFT_3117447 [Favolaschia claudopus]|uniref:HSF-type DNA-binding domain-containing protein n=1 Tax=Favolaschia claudopus TaxID=2862362 RepID=A0AAV9ZEV8_9AGAR
MSAASHTQSTSDFHVPSSGIIQPLGESSHNADLAHQPRISSSHLFEGATDFKIAGGHFASGNVTVNNYVSQPNSASTQISCFVDDTFSESEIYCKQLIRQKRGFPLYDQNHGVTLHQSDVGRITAEGAFDFFFNIYLPAEHPINNHNVPENFYPLAPFHPLDVYDQEHLAGSHVSTSSVQRMDPGIFPGGDFILGCQAPQGAAVREYAAANAEEWFKYINGPRGRRLTGPIYLITGCEKASSWGMATFHSVNNSPDFQLSFRPIVAASSKAEHRGNNGGQSRNVVLQDFPPSEIPNARVVISHDDNWRDENSEEQNDIVQSNGLVFLRKSHEHIHPIVPKNLSQLFAVDLGYYYTDSAVSGSDSTKIAVPNIRLATNTFVAKLYQMINDTESSHLISWTDPGTSFIIRNPGEFCRTVLGNHFTPQQLWLPQYNRTPAEGGATSDAQIWEFSHNKFLRGRPDLLGEVKGKSHEPRRSYEASCGAASFPCAKKTRRICEQLSTERQRIDRLVLVVNQPLGRSGEGFWSGKVLSCTYAGIPVPSFPVELLEPASNSMTEFGVEKM